MTTYNLVESLVKATLTTSRQYMVPNGTLSLHVTVHPLENAETVILLHGGPGVPDPVLEVAAILNEKFQVITFEQRGTGSSTGPMVSYTMEDYISDIDAIARYFQLDDFHLFGHSWGGLYAQIYARENPDRIRSLFLCSPSSGTNEDWKRTEKEVMQFNRKTATSWEWIQMGWYSLLGALGSDRAYQKLFKQVLTNYHKRHGAIRIHDAQLNGVRAQPINHTRKYIISYPSLPKMPEPPFPVAITYGDDDIYGTSRQAVIDRYPTAELMMISGSGHIPWLHQPQQFCEILHSFYFDDQSGQSGDRNCQSPAISQDHLPQIERILDRAIQSGKTPSAQYYLFNKDRVIYHYCSGYTQVGEQQIADQNTTYHAFSVTKTFTALAVLQLVERGLISLDVAVDQYLPNFPYGPVITVRQLLNHTAGIPNPISLSWIHLKTEHKDFNERHFFRNIFNKYGKVKSAPNEQFAYSNLGYVLLGQLIAQVSGVPYERYIEQNIITTLGLDEQDLGFQVFNPTHHATGYQKKISFTNLILGFFLDKGKFMGRAEGKWRPFRPYYLNGAAYGGLIGKPGAFVTYLQALLQADGRLLAPEYLAMLFEENRDNHNRLTRMCLSWFTGTLKGNRYYTHAGGGGGYYCEIRLYPERELGSVIFFNRSGMRDERYLDRLDGGYLDEHVSIGY
ncbi:MAG: alpha/beta fold hydrolase [Saprospiraceae bacterium]|nr:alpha/beta fold hydrolase [Lewinella sp.]